MSIVIRRPIGASPDPAHRYAQSRGPGRHVRAAPGPADSTRPRVWRFCREATPLLRLDAGAEWRSADLRKALGRFAALAGHADYEFGAARDPATEALVREGRTALRVDGVLAYEEWDADAGESVLVHADHEEGRRAGEALLADRDHGRALSPPLMLGAFAEISASLDYRAGVSEIVARIRAGDLFQANLARFFAADVTGEGADPLALFAGLTASAPGPYAAFSDFGDMAVLSNTPELFLDVRDALIRTKPIKGTAARRADPAEDSQIARDLEDSEKDRAENMMIVDLMRNDLAKVCTDASIRVDAACRLERFAGVHHLVSEVSGRLRSEMDAFDAFGAAFPPGSITGAPKREAMALIDRLEGRPRGAYCGSSFWIEGARQALFTVAIRTAEWRGGPNGERLHAAAGAGITAASDPEAEWRETEHKLHALADLLAP